MEGVLHKLLIYETGLFEWPPCINPLSTSWILKLSLSCFRRGVQEMWAHLEQVTVLMVPKEPGRGGAPSDFAPGKKTPLLILPPHPAQGIDVPSR